MRLVFADRDSPVVPPSRGGELLSTSGTGFSSGWSVCGSSSPRATRGLPLGAAGANVSASSSSSGELLRTNTELLRIKGSGLSSSFTKMHLAMLDAMPWGNAYSDEWKKQLLWNQRWLGVGM